MNETGPVVHVRAPADSSSVRALALVAERLGARIEVGVSNAEDGTVVGDRVVPEDAPSWVAEAALLRALSPRHVLFLCVANSARSQLAEGIARDLAPEGVTVSSAGSEPGSIRPQAVAALAELGIDASEQHSKGVHEVSSGVDAVVTLCAEEVCPVWLGSAWRLHWGLPDPAGVEGSEEERMAFRTVRDELVERLRYLLGSA